MRPIRYKIKFKIYQIVIFMLFQPIVRESAVFMYISYVSSIFLIFAFKERFMQN